MLRGMLGDLFPSAILRCIHLRWACMTRYTNMTIACHIAIPVTVQPRTAGELKYMQWDWKNSTRGEPAGTLHSGARRFSAVT